MKGRIMKIKINNRIYLVHWQTRKISPNFGNRNIELTETTCVLRHLQNNGEKIELERSVVRQNYRDSSDGVLARKLAFTKIIRHFNRDTRCIFWQEYKNISRLTKRTMRVKNSILQAQVIKLQTEINQLRKTIVSTII